MKFSCLFCLFVCLFSSCDGSGKTGFWECYFIQERKEKTYGMLPTIQEGDNYNLYSVAVLKTVVDLLQQLFLSCCFSVMLKYHQKKMQQDHLNMRANTAHDDVTMDDACICCYEGRLHSTGPRGAQEPQHLPNYCYYYFY